MTQTTLRGVVDGLRAELQMVDPAYELNFEEAPTLQDGFPLLGKETTEDPFVPFDSGFVPKDLDPCLYLHSSGIPSSNFGWNFLSNTIYRLNWIPKTDLDDPPSRQKFCFAK
jgi:hypothetical protein